MTQETVDIVESNLEYILSLKWVGDLARKLEHFDITAYDHSKRVARLSMELCMENGYEDASLIEKAGVAGMLHDIGKLGMPFHILLKKEPLTDDEFDIIKMHPKIGYDLLYNINRSVAEIVVMHHEWKSDPYPRSSHDRRLVTREEGYRRSNNPTIELFSQMVSAADMFDALAHPRIYMSPIRAEELEETLKGQYKGDLKYIDQAIRLRPHLSKSAR